MVCITNKNGVNYGALSQWTFVHARVGTPTPPIQRTGGSVDYLNLEGARLEATGKRSPVFLQFFLHHSCKNGDVSSLNQAVQVPFSSFHAERET